MPPVDPHSDSDDSGDEDFVPDGEYRTTDTFLLNCLQVNENMVSFSQCQEVRASPHSGNEEEHSKKSEKAKSQVLFVSTFLMRGLFVYYQRHGEAASNFRCLDCEWQFREYALLNCLKRTQIFLKTHDITKKSKPHLPSRRMMGFLSPK